MDSMAQVIDAVALINALTVAMSPSMAMGNLYITTANAMGMAAMNQVFSQQQANISHQAALVAGVKSIYA